MKDNSWLTLLSASPPTSKKEREEKDLSRRNPILSALLSLNVDEMAF